MTQKRNSAALSVSDSTFGYLFLQVDVASIYAAIRDWTVAQILGGATDLNQLVWDGTTLRGLIEANAAGGSAFIAQVIVSCQSG